MATRVGGKSRSQGCGGMAGVVRKHSLSCHRGNLASNYIGACLALLAHGRPDIVGILAAGKKLALSI